MPSWTKAAVLGVVALLILGVVFDPGFLTGGGDGDAGNLPGADGPAASNPAVGAPDPQATATPDAIAATLDALTASTPAVDPVQELLERIQANPDDADGWMELGGILVDAGDYSRASEAYAAAVEANAEDAEARAGLGQTLLFMGLLRVARAELIRAIDLDPDHAQAHLNLGITYSHSAPTDMDAARTAWDRVIELDPESDAGTQAQAYLDSYAEVGSSTDEPGEDEPDQTAAANETTGSED